MTKDTLSETAALRALLSETSDTQLLAEMLGFVADRLMALDVDQLCGAGTHERSADRVNHRNGYRTRAWETRAGRVDVKIPKQHLGSYFPEFLEPRRAAEKAMTAVIQEAYVQGLSTRAASKEHWAKLIEAFAPRHSKLAELMRRAEEDVLAYKSFPREYWAKIHSTNPLERLNREIKRRTNVIGSFPNEAAVTRLAGAPHARAE